MVPKLCLLLSEVLDTPKYFEQTILKLKKIYIVSKKSISKIKKKTPIKKLGNHCGIYYLVVYLVQELQRTN